MEAARTGAVTGPVGAAGGAALIAALIERIGAAGGVDALPFAAGDRARLAGAGARGRAADVLRADRRRALAARGARGAGRLGPAATVHARRAGDAVRRRRARRAALAVAAAQVLAARLGGARAALTLPVAQRRVHHRRAGARLRATDHAAGVHGACAGAVAGAVAHAAGDAVVGAFVARVGADRRVHARPRAARQRARLAHARALRSAADAVEAEAALAAGVVGARLGDLAARHDRRVRAGAAAVIRDVHARRRVGGGRRPVHTGVFLRRGAVAGRARLAGAAAAASRQQRAQEHAALDDDRPRPHEFPRLRHATAPWVGVRSTPGRATIGRGSPAFTAVSAPGGTPRERRRSPSRAAGAPRPRGCRR